MVALAVPTVVERASVSVTVVVTVIASRNFELGPQNRTGMHVKQPKKTPWNNTYVFSKSNSAKFSRISQLYVFLRSQNFLQS